MPIIGAAGILSGCVGAADIGRSKQFDVNFAAAKFDESILDVGGEEADRENLLTMLQAAEAARAAGYFQKSVDYYDAAENMLMWKADKVDTVDELVAAGGTFLTNDLAAKYTGNIFEGILVNTFKATAAIYAGDENRARVEFNRVAQRQENAIDQLAAKIGAASEGGKDESHDKHSSSIEKSQSALSENEGLQQRLAAIESLGKYDSLRNPYSDYLHGIFRLTTGDAAKAADLLRNATVLSQKSNSYVIEDFALAEKHAASVSEDSEGRVWVVLEDGLGPVLDEYRIDLPVWLVSSRVLYSGVALPEFRQRASAFGAIGMMAGGKYYQAQHLLSVDRLAATEFQATYDAVVAKAVGSAVVKTIIQAIAAEQLNDQVGGWGALLGQVAIAATQASLTRADTRAWSALPKDVYVASFPRPENGKITLDLPIGAFVVDVPNTQYSLVTVKAVTAHQQPMVYVTALPPAGAATPVMPATMVASQEPIDRSVQPPESPAMPDAPDVAVAATAMQPATNAQAEADDIDDLLDDTVSGIDSGSDVGATLRTTEAVPLVAEEGEIVEPIEPTEALALDETPVVEPAGAPIEVVSPAILAVDKATLTEPVAEASAIDESPLDGIEPTAQKAEVIEKAEASDSVAAAEPTKAPAVDVPPMVEAKPAPLPEISETVTEVNTSGIAQIVGGNDMLTPVHGLGGSNRPTARGQIETPLVQTPVTHAPVIQAQVPDAEPAAEDTPEEDMPAEVASTQRNHLLDLANGVITIERSYPKNRRR